MADLSIPSLSNGGVYEVDATSADAAARLRCKTLASMSCREAERLLDSNFRANDETVTTLQGAWDCTVRLDCQLGEAERPDGERNRMLRSFDSERLSIIDARNLLEVDLLAAKLQVQLAASNGSQLCAPVLSVVLADVLERNVSLRENCAKLCEGLEMIVRSVAMALRELGIRPECGVPDVGEERLTRRWRVEFESLREANDALLKTLKHPDANLAVPSCTIEERIDVNWKFLLELVGLLEKIDSEPLLEAEKAEEVEETKAEAKELLSQVEEQLPALLECKYLAQEAAAFGRKVDVRPAASCLEAAQRVQTVVWRFLTTRRVDLSTVCPTKFAEEMLPHPAAFGPARSEAYTGPEGSPHRGPGGSSVLRFLTYNIFMRAPAPTFAHNNGNDKKDARLQRFAQHLCRYDLVCLQEMFGAFSQRRDWLIEVAQQNGFTEVHRSPTSVRPRFLVDGGLLILSRLPMVTQSVLTFEPGTHLDRLSAKGALYARLRGAGSCDPFLTGAADAEAPLLHVCTTHFQSTYTEESLQHSVTVREAQTAQLVQFLLRETDDGEDPTPQRRWPLLLCGTLNVNGRKSAMDGSHSAEYLALLHVLRESLGEVQDLLYDIRGSHPVTYADTRLSGSGEVPAERVLTNAGVYCSAASKRQRLDYVFFFPYVNHLSPRGNVAPVVPATCQIEKFLVDRTKDVGAPVTQLSDHYGIEATFAVIASHQGRNVTDPGTPASQRSDGTTGGAQVADDADQTMDATADVAEAHGHESETAGEEGELQDFEGETADATEMADEESEEVAMAAAALQALVAAEAFTHSVRSYSDMTE